MAASATIVPPRKKKFGRNRVELYGEPEWIRKVTAEANRLGLNLSAYVRFAVNLDLERREASRQSRRGKSED
jgi:hypothetical protein